MDIEQPKSDKKHKKSKKGKYHQDDHGDKQQLESNEVSFMSPENDDLSSKKAKKAKKHKLNDEESIGNAISVSHDVNEDTNEEDDEREARRLRKAAKKAKKEAKKHVKLVESSLEASRMETILSSVIPKAKKSSSSAAKFGIYSHYVEDDQVINMSDDQVSSYRLEQGITVSPEKDSLLFKPLTSFSYLHRSLSSSAAPTSSSSLSSLSSLVTSYFTNKRFQSPSAVQAQCWPALLAGRDVIGIAMTGSGKTLAFLIPGMLMLERHQHVINTMNGRQVPSPRMLILAPTRELAMQSYQVIEEMGGAKGICLYGGASKEAQIAQLRAGVDIVVATPGRLVDLIEGRSISLQNVIYAVLDEADRMLDEGFIPSIRQILATCPPKRESNTEASIITRQTVMFSATWPEEIRALAETFMAGDAVRVTVGSAELSANHRVTQIVEVLLDTSYPLRDRKLIELLDKYHRSRTNRCLIFVLYKKEAVTLQRQLQSRGYKVTSIHGDKSQNERFAALNEFKDGSTPLLIATDVAARGLDIPQVEYVINYSFPLTVEDYVHRIGRTGRGGSTGISHTFFTDNDKGLAAGLVGVLTEANQTIPQEIYKFPMFTKKKPSNVYGNFGPKAELQGTKAKKITFDD